MTRPPLHFTAIRQQVPCQLVLDLVDWRPIAFGRNATRGPCPIHHSTYPRSRVFCVFKEICYCHKCHWCGDVIDLFAAIAGISKLDAAYGCCALANISPPVLNYHR